ncbi:helix-turn-helix domain-containing protein [Salinarimonas rosea]|uniref:helix-turn-helix domain-containing protein n=1 Tax=Salinarimonas rosea TaxID=552063 RepID=UPI00041715FD|nr:helix-turn-helix domain-containing protein [Salinarimonas rosea]
MSARDVIGSWVASADAPRDALVLPDGCVDLILARRPGTAPELRVSALMDAPTRVRLSPGERLAGFRLAPGRRVDVGVLSAVPPADAEDAAAILDRLPEIAPRSPRLEEALACLAEARDVAGAAARAGVAPRTLQRLVRAETGRSPDFWRRLARARRAGRALLAGTSPAEAAFAAGYADQAHLTRELSRWLGTTPGRLVRDETVAGMVLATGYG